jgi:hypothetical protein
MNIDLEYIYKLLGMKELELHATREERDKFKKDLEDMREYCVSLQEEVKGKQKTKKGR